MSMKQTLTAAMVCALALSFNAFATVAYDNEVTKPWFSVDASHPGFDDTAKWHMPTNGGTATGSGEVIKLDTDLDDPLTYKPADQSTNVAIVSACFEATANVSEPTLVGVPQAALTVIANGADTNWYGLVGGGQEPSWEKFTTLVPVVGTSYDVKIEFDLQSSPKQIRYSVGGTVLGTGWYPNPQTGAGDHITSVSFAGTGDIGDFSGSNVVAAAAGFNGVNYETFDAAMDAAKLTWPGGGTTPVILYEDANYPASETETIYVNANTHTFNINGEVAVDKVGNTYTITKGEACEAKIGSDFYSTIEKAIAAATAGQTILVNTAINKALTFNNTSVTLDTNGKTVTCATLTVANGVTLTLVNALAVTAATINGAVAGETLTVKELTGWNIAKLALAADAVITYDAAHVLQPLSVSSVTINGLGAVKVGDVVLKTVPTGSYTPVGLPADKCLEAQGGQLVVASAVEIDDPDNVEGYDYTNGTVNVETTLKSGTGTAVLTVVDFQTGAKTSYEKVLAPGEGELSWDLTGLVPGGAYTYTIDVKVGDTTVATKTGEFTAAKWGSDGDWFYANASKNPDAYGGAWVVKPTSDDDGRYVVEDSRFNVTSTAGSGKFTRVDTKVSFESLLSETPETVNDAIGGFVATTEGWKALGTGGWVTLSGGAAPAVNVEYVIRAELDFPGKRVRFLVDAGDGAGFVALTNATDGAWVAWTKEQDTLQAVEFNGSGVLASINATVADKAIAMVGDVECDSMAEAFVKAGTDGTKPIVLLTNATIDPSLDKKGKYEISADGFWSMSGGKASFGDRTIIVDGSGEPPLVRPSEAVMKAVTAPGGAKYKDTDNLRAFLERNQVTKYTDGDADSDDIQKALEEPAANGLTYWQDYALGIDKKTPVAPVTTPAGDKDERNITLAIPTIDTSKYSRDYDISYRVMKGSDVIPSEAGKDEDPGAILIPLTNGTGTYTIKVLFTPATAQ